MLSANGGADYIFVMFWMLRGDFDIPKFKDIGC